MIWYNRAMHRTIQTTYRYRLDPTVEQEAQLRQFAGARRFVWNWGLNRKREHFRQTGKTLKFSALCAELTKLKQQPATVWLRELENAYEQFFHHARNGDKKRGFSKFKSRKTDMLRFRIPQRVVLIDAFVSVPKIGMIKAIVHRPLEGITKSATFKREACGHWYISLVTEQQLAPKVDRSVETHIGIDVGLKSLAVLLTGETIENCAGIVPKPASSGVHKRRLVGRSKAVVTAARRGSWWRACTRRRATSGTTFCTN